uniref:Uncharacterized protein n=1 Tax=Anguilla anguilla TaxID=7936 RepID=A0A0E9TAK8_ANGAN
MRMYNRLCNGKLIILKKIAAAKLKTLFLV